ncbi:MAG: hypothetical protein K2X52_04055 [Mycobacteriaceae bacterium]|nr:hypothetical protein [Mycobacteriaceae bacterium]
MVASLVGADLCHVQRFHGKPERSGTERLSRVAACNPPLAHRADLPPDRPAVPCNVAVRADPNAGGGVAIVDAMDPRVMALLASMLRTFGP